jgi:transposase
MKDMYDIRTLCKAVKLHHSVYYYHKQNRENSYKKANEELDKKITEEFEKSKKRYGSPKITKILNNQGMTVSQKRVARRMKILGLRSIIVKKFNHSGNKKVNDKNKENLLEQNFKADKPSEKWVGDITYIYTKETGWTYLAIVMDLYDLKIIGWSYGLNMTAELVAEAFRKAKVERGITKGMIFHSDLGSQYTSNEYERILIENNVRHSYSKKGYPYDNASMESFNAILKKEEVNVNTYATFKEAKLAIFEFIESWYNNTRIHSTLDYKTPNQKYDEYIKNIA